MAETLSSKETTSSSNERFPVILLIGQTLFAIYALSLLFVSANTMFVRDYGSTSLPYVYILSAIFVSLVSYGITELKKRLTLPKLATLIIGGFIVAFFIARLGLLLPNSQWIAFLLMVIFALVGQLYGVILGGQAGLIFDVRQLKRLFPMIMTGRPLGFLIGGLSVSLLIGLLGSVENLLFVASGSMFISFIFLLVILSRFNTKLSQSTPKKTTSQPKKSLRQILKKPYIISIFAYQMLSALASQLIAYIFISQVAIQFPLPEDMAQFFGTLMVVLNILSFSFLMLIAGRLLNRFGLRFGLNVNAALVVVLLAVMAVVGITSGLESVTFFWLAVIVYVGDLMLTVGQTNIATKAAYQPLLPDERFVVETSVEGMGVPIAQGGAGLILLIFGVINGLTVLHIVIFTLVMSLIWFALGLLVYRDYAGSLKQILSRRALGEAELSLDDSSSLAVVEGLLQSSRLFDVRLGLDMLTHAEHETLNNHLLNLVRHPNIQLRIEALKRIEHHRPEMALPLLEACLDKETDPSVKAAALRAWCALTESEAIEGASSYLDSPDPELRLGAIVGLLRYGGIPGVLAAGERLSKLEAHPDPKQRALVAQVIGEVGLHTFYQPLLSLLNDDDFNVRQAALVAAEHVHHTRLLPFIIDNLQYRPLRSAAMAALVAAGEAVLPLTAKALAGKAGYEEEIVVRLVRICGDIKGDKVISLLKAHLNHPDDDVQYQVLMSLGRCGYRASQTTDQAEVERTLQGEVKHSLRILLAKQDLGQDDRLTHLHRSLDYELDQVRKRVFLLLSFLHDSRTILRAEEQLLRGNSNQKGLTLETLDITLSDEQKGLVFPLIDESKPLAQRIQQLNRLFTLSSLDQVGRLREIIVDPEGVWTHGWTRTCAIYAVAKLELQELREVIEGALSQTEPPIPETVAWALHALPQKQMLAV